jgi:hypothetical protein
VNIPLVVIVPQLTDQVTLSPPLSVAVNCCVVPSVTVAEDGLTAIVFPVVTVIVAVDDEYTVPVAASAAWTRIVWVPAAKVTLVSNVLVLLWTVPATWSIQIFIYVAAPL